MTRPSGPRTSLEEATQSASIDTFGSNYFPGVSIIHALGDIKVPGISDTLNIGPGASAQGSQSPASSKTACSPLATRYLDQRKHTIGFGGSYSFTQLNTTDRRAGIGSVASADFGQFLQGAVTPDDDYNVTTFLQGDANRYFRANQLGLLSAGQVPDQAEPHAYRRHPLRLGRRPDARSTDASSISIPLFTPISLQLVRFPAASQPERLVPHRAASSSRATTKTGRQG